VEALDLYRGRALAYRFLATLYLDWPDLDWLANLSREGLLPEFPLPVAEGPMAEGLTLLAAACDRLAVAYTWDDARTLRGDYDQLFVGPGHLQAPPWESVYRTDEHLVFDWPTLEVREAYRSMGLAVRRQTDPDDHIGLELLFVATLCERAAAGDPGAGEAAGQFVNQHLLKWAPAFTADVVKHAQTDLYRGLGLLTAGLLAEAESDVPVK